MTKTPTLIEAQQRVVDIAEARVRTLEQQADEAQREYRKANDHFQRTPFRSRIEQEGARCRYLEALQTHTVARERVAVARSEVQRERERLMEYQQISTHIHRKERP